MVETAAPVLPLPKASPATLANAWLVCTSFVLKSPVAPAPVTEKVSPSTPIAVSRLPAKIVVPS